MMNGSLIKPLAIGLFFGLLLPQAWGNEALYNLLDSRAKDIEEKVITWRRDLHQNPELSNREFRTSKLVASHLKSLGMEVQTEVAHTGVVGLLKGGLPGPVVALRADMDALPVTENTDLPFASKAVSEYNGQKVGVMHACGHDAHTAILMGVAEVLAGIKDQIPGTVKFIFQPAEEGAPQGEEGGAELMVKEGVMKNPEVEAVFGLHISSQSPLNSLSYRPGGLMASSDRLSILVKGKQAHGASPWSGVDPVVVSAQIILALQTIPSRQVNATLAPSVISIGSIHGGVRSNIIPGEVELVGTIRSLDPNMRTKIHERIRRTAKGIAESAGAQAEVKIDLGYDVTVNDQALTAKMQSTMERVAGADKVLNIPPITGSEDFSFLAGEAPGLFFFLGATPEDVPLSKATGHHTPEFFVDEQSFLLGVRALCHLTMDYMVGAGK